MIYRLLGNVSMAMLDTISRVDVLTRYQQIKRDILKYIIHTENTSTLLEWFFINPGIKKFLFFGSLTGIQCS